jgi:conflict system STAND superfamily ATPase
MVEVMSERRISSPASTGGAGTFFEQHVGAYWLAQLLVRGIPPILIDTVITDVHFQTERLGWHTDDFLIICARTEGASRKLAGQVKRNFTVSAADDECRKAIGDSWRDFKNNALFSPPDDRFVLVTLRGTNTLLEHFVGLLDCARAAQDGADFEQRLAADGLISDKAVRYCREIQKIVSDIEGKPVTAAEVWSFLRVLHVLSLDLHSSTRQTEVHIKSQLAHTVAEGDPVGTAAASWNELVSIASTAMAEARSMRRTDLSAALQERHAPISSNDHRVLGALKSHTGLILRGIRSTIGSDFHLRRESLVQKVLSTLEEAQVVLVAGPAGCGKSAVGKDVVTILSEDHFSFGFRVEEFAQPHFDATLNAAQVPANATMLGAILAAQGRKLVLVESVERLLEKTTRDAFSDLMTLAADDSGMRIILTCRDYSIELVRASFLQPGRIKHAVIRVPPLDDAELMQAEAANPALAIPLKNPTLRNILRTPFFLDKALEISWSVDKPVPESEREFRALFWREIVRADHRVVPGMARRREEALQEVAVHRARALSAHVVCNDIDPAVVESLRRDSLVNSPEGNLSLVATAHDVLEDWAILQWLEEQHLTGEGSFKALSDAIGTHPAIRRSYRRWVAELIERDTPAADHLFQAAISETDISMQFRDDTLISLLKAPSAPEFLARHEAQLLTNDRAILKRVIHLLRVACVKTPEWLSRVTEHGSIINVPDGPAWPIVLRLVYRNLAGFAPHERRLLLGLIEDAARNISWCAPEFEGAESAAGIAHWLLDGLQVYGSEEPRKRVLKVIAKIPKADAARFEAVLRGHVEEEERLDPVADDLRELIYIGMDGMPAARDLPDLIISVGADYLLASEEDIRNKYRYSLGPLDVDLYFGIKNGLRHGSHPASALRGPWMHLLRYHPRKALDFIINVFNHSADWYAHPRLPDRLEPPWELEITFADGSTRKQWANARLWGLYRGTSMGPPILESLLMALESWLLEFGKEYPAQLDAVLVDILRRSDSAALAAVVASVATAYPLSSGEALLVLLSARDYIEIDRSRLTVELQLSALPRMFPTFRTDLEIYDAERKQANALPHRGHDLEAAIANIQLGPLAPRVHSILDWHLAELPPKEEQEEHDRVWRLAIHRMDLRQYTVSDTPGPEVPGAKPGEPPRRYVQLDPKPPDADVQAMVNESAARYAGLNARLSVRLWGLQAFRRENGKYDPTLWAAKLDEGQAMDRETDDHDGTRHAPGFVAAVCIRDHWDQMSPNQRDWCVDVVCSEVMRDADQWDEAERMQRNSMAADRAGAFVLALLLDKALAVAQMQHVRQVFAVALTHPIDEVRLYTTWSIDEKFWAANRNVALRCVNAIAIEAGLIANAWSAERGRRYNDRRQLRKINAEGAAAVQTLFWQDAAIPEDAHSKFDISDGFSAYATTRILIILGRIPDDPLAIAAFSRASKALVGWWKSGEDREHQHDGNFHTESDVSERLQEFLLRTSPDAAREVLEPVLGAIDRHSREVKSIMEGLTSIQDSNPSTPQYWFLWELIADAIKRAKWVSDLGNEYPEGSELLSAIFLTAYWKDNVRHWRYLDGYAHLVDALFESLPVTSIVLDNYVRFLYHIGEKSLPIAFVHVAAALRRGDIQEMLKKTNTVFLLEVLLQRHVYGRPLELKSDSSLRESILFILDNLVEVGSSAAFRMRDDFVTPAQ